MICSLLLMNYRSRVFFRIDCLLAQSCVCLSIIIRVSALNIASKFRKAHAHNLFF